VNSLTSLSVTQLRQALAIKEQIEALEKELASVLGAAPPSAPAPAPAGPKKRTMSASVRAKMSAARKAWWAKRRAVTTPAATAKPKRRLSPEGRRRIIAATKAYWAKKKAAAARPVAKPK
jgi:hypothetical protein